MASVNPAIRESISYGPQLHVLGGQYTFGQMVIPYFTAHMTLSEVCDFLQTPAEISQWTDEDEELEALYQRSIDYKRVDRSILPYLSEESAQRPKFFNSLTVALIPRRSNNFVPYSEPGLSPPANFPRSSNTSNAVQTGPLLLGFYAPFDSANPDTYLLGELCWNKEEIACVAIDGQHRLHALKKVHELFPDLGENTRISVIFIVPSATLGYRHAYANDYEGVIKLLRSVFIDLNKNAVPVRRSRLILLDDNDPQCILVRRLVFERLQSMSSAQVISEENRIPLPLVDWHSDEAKFDQGPYITTVLMLDRVVQTLLDFKAVKDWADTGKVEKQFRALQRFGYQPSDECLARLQEFSTSEEEWQSPFSYPFDELQRIQRDVGENLAQIIFYVLTSIDAYKELIRLRFEHDMLSADFSSWYERYVSKDRTDEDQAAFHSVQRHIQAKQPRPNVRAWIEVLERRVPDLKEECLFFKVVFQDAMFHALKELFKLDLPALGPGEMHSRHTQPHRLEWARVLVELLNGFARVEARFWYSSYQFQNSDGVQKLFWLGSLVNAGNLTVDFTNSGMVRTASWLKLMCSVLVGATRWKEVQGSLGGLSFDGFMEAFREEDADFERAIRSEIERIKFGSSNNDGSMRRIAKSQVEERDEEWLAEVDRVAGLEMDMRLERIWDLVTAIHD